MGLGAARLYFQQMTNLDPNFKLIDQTNKKRPGKIPGLSVNQS